MHLESEGTDGGGYNLPLSSIKLTKNANLLLIAYEGLVLGLWLLIRPIITAQLPQKLLTSKVVKSNSNSIILLHKTKYVTHSICTIGSGYRHRSYNKTPPPSDSLSV